MTARISLRAIVGAACIAAASTQGFAEPATVPPVASAPQIAQDIDVWGFLLPIDFNTLVFILFETQTNDTAEPVDVNDQNIVSNYDDNSNGFYWIL